MIDKFLLHNWSEDRLCCANRYNEGRNRDYLWLKTPESATNSTTQCKVGKDSFYQKHYHQVSSHTPLCFLRI